MQTVTPVTAPSSAASSSKPAVAAPPLPRANRVISIPDFTLGERLTAEQTDYFEHHAMAQLALAEILGLSGRREEARTAVERAIELYGRKESVFGVGRASARLRELAGEALAERE